MRVGIESIRPYLGRLSLAVEDLFEARGLDASRLGNLLMDCKSVAIPLEDPVTNAVNAAKPLIDELTESERDAIELLIVGTESGLDYGKPISTYIAEYLGLSKNIRSFETKHACYGATAALHMAANTVATSQRPEARALVIAADSASSAARNTYWEPSQGTGAVAMVVSKKPLVLALDPGANGFYSFEVMDTLRPLPDLEAGNSDLSLLSYMSCLENSFEDYGRKVEGADVLCSFDKLVFHTPFAGMVRASHGRLMRKHSSLSREEIAADFTHRVESSLHFCQAVGNLYSGALYLALCSLLDHWTPEESSRLGLFSYGSGCCSEFYSGVVDEISSQQVRRWRIQDELSDRHILSMEEYEMMSDGSVQRMAGVKDVSPVLDSYNDIYSKQFDEKGLLILEGIEDYHRSYRWS